MRSFSNERIALKIATLVLLCLGGTAAIPRQEAARAERKAAVKIHWEERPGVSRYRLQLARDDEFKDIVFDRLVSGHEYVVADLSPGAYYWRVAPAEYETGRFSAPALIKAGERPVPLLPSPIGGWRALIGKVLRPSVLSLDPETSLIVGTNERGMTYALEASTGAVRWISRPEEAESRAVPVDAWTLPLPSTKGKRVLVAQGDRVRVLDAVTGRELWRQRVSGTISGTSVVGASDAKALVATAGPATLRLFEGETGREIWSVPLETEAIGAPSVLSSDEGLSLFIAHPDGMIERRDDKGKRLRAIKLAVPATTPPVFVKEKSGRLIVGTARGLVALAPGDLRTLWEKELEDGPRGEMAVENEELAFVTARGRVSLFDLMRREIKWSADGAVDARAVMLVDLDGDGANDLLAPAGSAFAMAWRRRDGVWLWQAEEASEDVRSEAGGELRSLVIVSGERARYAVGGDRWGLRAVALPTAQ
jgi:outer membrane protein assembly factor BamB